MDLWHRRKKDCCPLPELNCLVRTELHIAHSHAQSTFKNSFPHMMIEKVLPKVDTLKSKMILKKSTIKWQKMNRRDSNPRPVRDQQARRLIFNAALA